MATYIYHNEYEEKEVEHPMSENPEIKDSEGRPMKRKFTAINFKLKGSGYYSTDNPRSNWADQKK